MDIEEIEKFLVETIDVMKKTDVTPSNEASSVIQCQLLLHIYHKLEAIEDHVRPRRLGEISYSQRVY